MSTPDPQARLDAVRHLADNLEAVARVYRREPSDSFLAGAAGAHLAIAQHIRAATEGTTAAHGDLV